MLRKRRFPAKKLVPNGGEIYATIHENSLTGFTRNLIWSLTIRFKPVDYDGSQMDCSMTCEWIPWAIRDWRELDSKRLDVAYGDDGIEASFYSVVHDYGNRTELRVQHKRDNIFTVEMKMVVEYSGYYGGDADPAMKVSGKCDVPFSGLLIVPDNLEPEPVGVEGIKEVAAQFVDLSCYNEPEKPNHAYVFRPKL